MVALTVLINYEMNNITLIREGLNKSIFIKEIYCGNKKQIRQEGSLYLKKKKRYDFILFVQSALERISGRRI